MNEASGARAGRTEVLLEKRGAVQWITIAREERRNAMNDAVIAGIADGLSAAAADPEIRAVVLTGAGDQAFCAGADLSAGSGSFKYDYSKVGVPFVGLMKQARDLTLPLIARVNGHAMAGGLGFLGMCDMAVAVDTARFGMPEVKVGVFPLQIMAVLQRLIPNRKLYEMALTGEPIGAAEALELGLVNYVVPASELDTKLSWLLARLLDKSPTAIRRGKYAMRQTESMSFDQAAAFMEAQIGALALTGDAAEGRRAFIEKRTPVWTGR
jgi:enoyl-CoA hydratase/carnithine racemase